MFFETHILINNLQYIAQKTIILELTVPWKERMEEAIREEEGTILRTCQCLLQSGLEGEVPTCSGGV